MKKLRGKQNEGRKQWQDAKFRRLRNFAHCKIFFFWKNKMKYKKIIFLCERQFFFCNIYIYIYIYNKINKNIFITKRRNS